MNIIISKKIDTEKTVFAGVIFKVQTIHPSGSVVS